MDRIDEICWNLMKDWICVCRISVVLVVLPFEEAVSAKSRHSATALL